MVSDGLLLLRCCCAAAALLLRGCSFQRTLEREVLL
jgi:hypothetical protein